MNTRRIQIKKADVCFQTEQNYVQIFDYFFYFTAKAMKIDIYFELYANHFVINGPPLAQYVQYFC